jgi:TolB protein
MSDDVRLQLLVLDLGAGTWTEITNGDSRDERAAFDPTGERVVFVSNRGGTRGLWAVPIDGGLEAALVYEQPTAYRPWFAADGESVFFFQRIGDRDQICRVGLDGTRFTPVINDDRGISHGPWADPDGETLLMHSNRDGLWGIYELPLAGGPPERLDPPGFESAAHATRGKNGLFAFDA